MAASDYINEKLRDGIECMCSGQGTFEDRLFRAWVSGLGRLNSNDPPAEIAEELNVVLHLCRKYLGADGIVSEVSEVDRRLIAKNLVHILVETSRMVTHD
jgi:hypothetical protein